MPLKTCSAHDLNTRHSIFCTGLFSHLLAISTIMYSCPQQEEDLPPGWERRLDPSGRPFYIDHAHRTTQWVCHAVSFFICYTSAVILKFTFYVQLLIVAQEHITRNVCVPICLNNKGMIYGTVSEKISYRISIYMIRYLTKSYMQVRK